MALPASCAQALNSAENALKAIPGFAADIAELDAIILSTASSDGLTLLGELAALIRVARRIYTRASLISTSAAKALNLAISCLVSYLSSLGGSTNVACNTTHSSKVQGAGLCCAAVQSGQLLAPPPGTTLAPYTKGSAANFAHVNVTTANGHCGNCLIVGSKNQKHPGRPVLKFIPGGPGCPSSSTGCCALGA